MTQPPEPAYPQVPDLGTPPSPPPYPQAPSYPQAPAYPRAPAYPSPQAPAYPHVPSDPRAAAYPQEPSYPQVPTPPQTIQPPSIPPTPPVVPTAPTTPPATHPHHLTLDQRRVHIAEHQRGADATAVGSLLLHLPNFLCSLFVVALPSPFLGGFGVLLILVWLASGVLVFHRPTESVIARRLLGLRHPLPQERALLEPVWREVTARAGVEADTYELWIEDSDSLNAVAAAGHIVGVTRFAMHQLPNGELAAVLAHELGHHVGGHAWSSLLGYWYALPGRMAWRFLRAFSRIVLAVSRAFSCFGVGMVLLVFGAFAMATISSLYGLPLLVLAMPYALAAVGRRAELRADQHAAALGFAPMLAAVLHKLHLAEQQREAMARRGGVPVQESALSKLLSSHPDHYTRLHHLQPYLQPQPYPQHR
ncbi:M48 family metalloprotease [Streptomyces sp. NPDC059743]|uniref:M48 family metalloprotease n=1 Tax=Streptomyces sp. NPDC059743 TaxID=3346928 RepID=UPI003664CE99